ncbi:phage antirepressor KilAC domain-containing protein [Cupriavidus sp. D39]|nr:phage antirepressor KilAC domain-containing protein [Cupriavidus sp. D39]
MARSTRSWRTLPATAPRWQHERRGLAIQGVDIRMDAAGRYCLNDLQRAATAGMNSRTVEVHEFMRRPETCELISEISNTGNSRITPLEAKRGNGGGTYVCKELVYAYAMWISASFHLKVIRAYDAMASDRSAPAFAVPQSLPEALRLAADLAEQNSQLTAKVAEQAPKVEFHDSVTEAVNCQTVQEVAKILGTGPNRLFTILRDRGLLMRNNVPYQEHLDAGRFRVVERKFNNRHGETCVYCRTLVTGKGLTYIQRHVMGLGQTNGGTA